MLPLGLSSAPGLITVSRVCGFGHSATVSGLFAHSAKGQLLRAHCSKAWAQSSQGSKVLEGPASALGIL